MTFKKLLEEGYQAYKDKQEKIEKDFYDTLKNKVSKDLYSKVCTYIADYYGREFFNAQDFEFNKKTVFKHFNIKM